MKKFLKGKMKRYIGNGTEIKKLLAFLSTTDYILVGTEVYNYGCIIREYK